MSDHVSAVVETRGITKSFGGVPVLKGISLALEPGTITAIAGENGAGKSTLMKIITGLYAPDSGTVLVDGEELEAGNPLDAIGHGIAIVPQELASIPELTVAENIFLGREPRGALGLIDRGKMFGTTREYLEEFGLDIPARARMGALPVGVRQIIEIIKATHGGAKAIFLDEPTSAIAKQEVATLLDTLRSLRAQGVSLFFTTHKMEEIRAVADRVVVLRDGALIVDSALADITDEGIVTAMIGRKLEDLFPDLPPAHQSLALEVSGLRLLGFESQLDFTVRHGEILGLAGLVGAGRTELLEALFGVRKVVEGTVVLNGEPVQIHNTRAAINAGFALVPEDRKVSGAVMQMNILDNASLPRIGNYSAGGLIKAGARRSAVEEAMTKVALRSRGLSQEVGTLSGGNQQKVVLGRWLTDKVEVLLLDEPTRGVDVGARREIYELITKIADTGTAVIMASSDMPEILSLSHRALVLAKGSIVAELSHEEMQQPDAQDRIFRYASAQALAPIHGE
ncbi:ABC transporter-like protein [Arthrobacter crystallopoietes BAB-32]|uniref:ABC transporter-like protein n=1 Tax=Arthrobacter crystallopoietes BAB-32 TaxID=1246476 RepID=N1V614_9MICC|nr:sugar ABC transporter ATP-binding protein [Arthrobacter crystallopoietes]EMY35542.1 ABC transporter-like protein [Arthrobacter crystallopoietes BAB-32]